jgi:ribosomal protein S18 acetylase RimI-like enzyme
MAMNHDSPLIRLAKSDIPKAVAMLSRSFAGDPFVGRLITGNNRRPSDFDRVTRCLLHYAIVRGEVYAVSPNLEGVVVWFPPSRVAPSVWDMVRFGAILLPFSLSWRSSRLVLAYERYAATLRKQLLREPHWYLQLLGVDPNCQGRGCAGVLLRHVLTRLDRERLPSFLETMNEKNVALYENFGFRVLQASEIPGSDCTCWFMARKSPQ